MDRYDKKIITALHENARISFAELARRVNLSAPAIADRVEKLERAGVITGYHARINPGKIGYPIQCMIELTVKHQDYFIVVDQLCTMPEIIECFSVTGTSGLMLKVAVDSMPSLQALIARLMQYGDTKTAIVIDVPVALRMPEILETE
jgi:Lrp/AsnC family leucine-responsive transcriptional regulator